MSSADPTHASDLDFEGDQAFAYWRRFSAMLAISVVIATIGLYRNSGAVVIAAMLIAPLMTPILGIAASMVMGRIRRILYLLASVSIASVGTVALAFAILMIADAPRGMEIPREVTARTDPGLEELMVALAAGIAGAYVQMRKEEMSLLPGVAIGVSLVPPLSAAGMLLYFGSPDAAWEATLLYLTNLAAIVLSACGVFFALGMRPPAGEKSHARRFGFGAVSTLVIVVILSVELASVTIDRFREARDEERVVAAVSSWAGDHSVEIARVDVLKGFRSKTVELWLIIDVPIVFGEATLSPSELIPPGLKGGGLKKALIEVLGREADVVFRVQLRYAGLFDLRTETLIGPAPDESEGDDPQ